MSRDLDKQHVNDYGWKPCILLGRIPGAYVEERLLDSVRKAVRLEGHYDLWDIRHSEDDWDLPCQLKDYVLVNWFGSVAVPKGSLSPVDGDDTVWLEDSGMDLEDAFVGDDIGDCGLFDEHREEAERFIEEFLLLTCDYEMARESLQEELDEEGETENA